MARTLGEHLEDQGLLPSTAEKYQDILETAPALQGQALVSWVEHKADGKTPLGTVLPLRAAVKHYLVRILGYREEDVQALLPKAVGKKAKTTPPLSAVQLAMYHREVSQMPSGAARVVLTLLPMTGLRISEVCNLRRGHLTWCDERRRLTLSIANRHQVGLTKAATTTLVDHIRTVDPEDHLFVTENYGSCITPHAIRKYTRAMAGREPGLEGLTPQVLRSTFAVMALRNGMSLEKLSLAMGHSSLQTTARYVTLVSDS